MLALHSSSGATVGAGVVMPSSKSYDGESDGPSGGCADAVHRPFDDAVVAGMLTKCEPADRPAAPLLGNGIVPAHGQVPALYRNETPSSVDAVSVHASGTGRDGLEFPVSSSDSQPFSNGAIRVAVHDSGMVPAHGHAPR